ncbi:uncharacterized protein LOC123296320 [Chrysoperla carnea]|uniref:uncharacterized protein LOC123296320 n=1 Tax=Chrysoperla carnea TaxID=189513 RepID=UPI001D08B8EE|nr:uncharacterized protein LOC123296320 [Chrysoperla carnea]
MEMDHGSYTKNIQKHVPYSVGYYVHCTHDPNQSFYKAYRGADCVKWFVHELEQVAYSLEQKIKHVKPMYPLTVEQELDFMSAEKCHICGKDFVSNSIRVRDHSHRTGIYRGAAHQFCNLHYQDSRVIPVVMHNLSGYDSHFIIEALLTEIDGQVDVLPINKEKYISFTKHVSDIQLRFIDSFRFLADKLENLASYLDNDKKSILHKEVSNDEQFQLLTRKGVFPYEYMSSWGRLQETKLPPKEAFYSVLTDEHITDEDYNHAIQMDTYERNVMQTLNVVPQGGSTDMMKKVERALRLIKTVEEAERWMILNKQNIRLFKKMLMLKKENPLRLEANIGLCKSYQRQLHRLRLDLVKQGGGVTKKQNRHLIWETIETHHQGRVKTGMITNLDYKDPNIFFNRAFPMFRRHVRRELVNHPLKVYIMFTGNFIKPTTKEEDLKTFITSAKEMYLTTDMQEWYTDHAKNYLLKKLEEFQERDSGWALDMIINIRVHMNKYSPITAGTFCELPPVIKNKLAHSVNCGEKEAVRVRMPETDDERFVEFKDFNSKERVEYMVYADFEALLVPQHHEDMEMDHRSYTKNIQKHVPYSVGYYVHCTHDPNQSFYKAYRGADCVKWFVHELEQVAYSLEQKIKHVKPMYPLTVEQELDFMSAEKCHICDKDFVSNSIRVRDHSHRTGIYRGAAHQFCNLHYQDSRVIPVVMHNLSGYDSHFIIEALLTEIDGQVDVLPINKEKYISFTKHVSDIQLRFIDSFRFLADKLENLASYLDNDKKSILHKEVSNDEQFQLLTRKGVFPYEYMSSWGRLQETKLPPKEAFYSVLTDEHITDEDYNHAIQVWNTFNLHTLGDYSDLYMKTDVLLLADIFENFRNTCIHSYNLDPSHYYTLPGYTWSAMLKYTNIKLELFTDIDDLLFIEKGIRGGVSQCSNRYAKANNKYMEEGYDKTQEDVYLMYYDVVNLYGAAMCGYLPTGNFKWVDTPNIEDVADDSPVGYILEVDLEIPQHLHDNFSDLPPCPETTKPPGSKQKYLLSTLYNKTNYVVHYRNLKLYTQLGVKVTKYHRVLKFDQSAWLKPYIDFNTEMRKNASNEFEKALFKLMINAIFVAYSLEQKIKHVKPMYPLTVEQELDFMSAEKCHICDKDFVSNSIRVRDHSHRTGIYRGAAHQFCNLHYQDSRVIPVVMHNLSGYDSHFIIEALLTEIDGQVDVLPINKEKYISFTKHVSDIQLRFIDSFRFLADKLENLASYLDNDKKSILHKEVSNDEQFQLLTRKGVFPYEYMSSWGRLQETKLPPKEAFYSVLTDEHITDEDYNHAIQVWNTFNLHTLGDYSDLYMKTDVLLLADIFENFRNTCIHSYNLDPSHYYTLPGYTWSAMLKYTNIKLELFTDIDDLLFIEKGIRGGVSQCSNRYAKANNKYMEEGYDKTQEDVYLMYYDVVNLYGAAMCGYLPTGNFKWVDTPNIEDVADDSPVGYILEVDLEIPQHLHDNFSDLPPCPETTKPPGSKQKYLLSTLYNKTNYVVHYRNLKLYTQLGVKVTKYHRVLKFDQSAWLKPYIDFNTEMRKNASNEFEKALFKLMINAIFGFPTFTIRLCFASKQLFPPLHRSIDSLCDVYES